MKRAKAEKAITPRVFNLAMARLAVQVSELAAEVRTVAEYSRAAVAWSTAGHLYGESEELRGQLRKAEATIEALRNPPPRECKQCWGTGIAANDAGPVGCPNCLGGGKVQ